MDEVADARREAWDALRFLETLVRARARCESDAVLERTAVARLDRALDRLSAEESFALEAVRRDAHLL